MCDRAMTACENLGMDGNNDPSCKDLEDRMINDCPDSKKDEKGYDYCLRHVNDFQEKMCEDDNAPSCED